MTVLCVHMRSCSAAACDTAVTPMVLIVEGYRFFFFSNEGFEPPHIHVEKGDSHAKWWLQSPPQACIFRGIFSIAAPSHAGARLRTRGRVQEGLA